MLLESNHNGAGLKHLGISAANHADVDVTPGNLRERGVELLYETPRHRPEFAPTCCFVVCRVPASIFP